MIRCGAMLGLAAGFAAFGGVHTQVLGATIPDGLTASENTITQGIVDAGPETVRPVKPVVRKSAPSGNPLWAVSLKSLSLTRDRPIFSPSRRPPAPVVVAAPYVPPVVPPPPKPEEPDHPLLTLVGTVVGETEAIGVFLDQAANNVIRLRTGQDYTGWILRSVQARETMFEKGRRTATLALPPPDAEQAGQLPTRHPAAALAGHNWIDGDGQIGPPPKRSSQPVAPPVLTAAELAGARSGLAGPPDWH
jgi:general secretion pathway protein N